MPTTAYATVVYGDSAFACAAAVLGATLRANDDSRSRVAVVSAVSARVRRILTHDGLWQLHEVQTTESRPSERSWRQRQAQTARRKNLLWSLPFDQVLYFDADSFVLPSPAGDTSRRARRLGQLWQRISLSDEWPLAATGVRPNHYHNLSRASSCFNGGFLMLRPDEQILAR